MANTPNFNLWSPDGSDGVDILRVQLANMQTSVDTALVGLRSTLSALPVNNVAERDARYPNPVQGDRVWRKDLGYEETYYALVAPGTNPQGNPVAGWVPSSAAWRATDVGGALTTNFLNRASLTLPRGAYKISGVINVDTSTTANVTYSSQLYNVTTTSVLLSTAFRTSTPNMAGPLVLDDVLFFPVTTQLQLRARAESVSGTQNINYGRLTAVAVGHIYV